MNDKSKNVSIQKYLNKTKKDNGLKNMVKDPLIKSQIEASNADDSNSVKTMTVDLSEFSKTYLLVLSDVHIGAGGCNLSKFARDLKKIAQIPEAVIIINGDALENSTLNGASNAHFDKINPEDQLKVLFKMCGVKEIKSKIIMIVSGNHENGARSRDSGTDILKHFSTGVGLYTAHADYNYAIKLLVRASNGKKQAIKVAGRHGSGGSSNNGSAIDQAHNILKVVDWANIVLVSHFHKGAIAKELCMAKDEKGNKKMVNTNFVSTTTYEEYDEFPASIALAPSNTDNYLMEINLIENPLFHDYKVDKSLLPKYNVDISMINMGSPKIDQIINRYKTNGLSDKKSVNEINDSMENLKKVYDELRTSHEALMDSHTMEDENEQ